MARTASGPVVFLLVAWTGVFAGHAYAWVIVVVAIGAAYILLLDNERFKEWARSEGGRIAEWFG